MAQDQTTSTEATEYLGDGVYASFDGYQVWLHVGSHTSPPAVALEPEVLQSLRRFAEKRGIKLVGS